jgi:long-chain acyl-CoA synthetase
MFHGFGLCMGVHALLCFGGGDALMPKFNAAETIDLLKKNRVNFIIGVPTLFEALLSHPDFAGPHLQNLKQAFVGGDFVSPALKAHFDLVMEKHGSQARMLEGYGLTEVVTVCSVNTLNDHQPDSVGRPLPGMTIKIVDLETRKNLPVGTSGEIAVSGDTRMIGYYHDPETNAKTFHYDENGNPFVLTGDYGHLGENGHLYFQQRLKRIIKVSGIPVMPSEVETLVTAFPGVAEAAAIAVDDTERGHRLKLFIRMKKDAPGPADENEIRQKIKAELSIFAVPKTIVFLDEMPHTLIGKVDIPALERQEKNQ